MLPTGNVLAQSRACMNVTIVNGYAYAACGSEIEIVELSTLERSSVNIAADDISADAQLGLLFIQSGTNLSMLSLSNPMLPTLADSETTNFSIFSGVSAVNGVLAVSGGSGGSNTQVYTYTNIELTRTLTGISAIDNAVGNPDVHLAQTANGIAAFYSQDISAVTRFAIQTAILDTQGQVVSVLDDVELATERFDFNSNLTPANFPMEGEFLNGTLYVAYFAVDGLEVISVGSNNQLQRQQIIPLGYEATNVATDGELLFVVGVTNSSVSIVDPVTRSVTTLASDVQLTRPSGVAASLTHVAVADRTDGLIVIPRNAIDDDPIPDLTPTPDRGDTPNNVVLPAVQSLLLGDD